MTVTAANIQAFYESDAIALLGVSRNPKKFGHAVMKTLLEKNKYKLIPVNPAAESILDTPCYKDIESLPAGINSIVIMTPKSQSEEQVKKAMTKGIKNIWVQQHSETPEIKKMAEDKNFNIITGHCILMFSDPAGFHKFHRSVKKLFGGIPK
jgi:predicted CoA-binding protein